MERCFLKYKELLAHLNVLAGKPGYGEQQGEEGGGGKKHGHAERLAVKVSCDGYLNVYPAHFLNLPLKFPSKHSIGQGTSEVDDERI